MMLPVESFWNRETELAKLAQRPAQGRFGYVTGRRRIGKTATLRKACADFKGLYHQAVEGTPEQQLLHLVEEIRGVLPIFQNVVPRSWVEFFSLLSHEKLPPLLVFDEFPYWVQGDPTLPSILQKWIDHELPKQKTLLLVSGSSQTMLNSQFLRQGAPLYGRATLHLNLEPLSYAWFCRALRCVPGDPLSFLRFSLVGGVPHYWKLLPRAAVTRQADELYFRPTALLSEEPAQWLRDEGVTGTLPKALLDLIGRGVSKPSELAARVGTVQGNLSRPLALLVELQLARRELPFGETPRSSKKVLYSIQDPALAFYYGTFLPLRVRWPALTAKGKMETLHRHASRQWKNFCRSQFPGAGRYWEKNCEFDLVAIQPGKERYLVAECKWKALGRREEAQVLARLQAQFSQSQLSRKLKKVSFRVFSQNNLEEWAALQALGRSIHSL